MAKAATVVKLKKSVPEGETNLFQAMSGIDRAKWISVVGLIILGLYLHSYAAWASPIVQTAGMLATFLSAAGLAFWTTQGMQFWQFMALSRTEMQKVAWPTRQETIQSTIAVVAMVTVVALFLWGTDSILLHLIGWVTASTRGA